MVDTILYALLLWIEWLLTLGLLWSQETLSYVKEAFPSLQSVHENRLKFQLCINPHEVATEPRWARIDKKAWCVLAASPVLSHIKITITLPGKPS